MVNSLSFRQPRVFTQTTEFAYNGLGARLAVSVEGYGTTRYTLDYAAGNRILAETTPTETVSYLYGHDCLGEQRGDELALSGAEGWLYYLHDAEGYVRQGVDITGDVVSVWLFDPDGTVLEGPNGPVSHLICGGVYDWSTGLIYQGGRYFDPNLGIWLALMPLMVVQGWRKRKDKRQWVLLVCVGLFMVGSLAGCGNPPAGQPPLTVCSTPTPISGLGPGTGTPTPTLTPSPWPTFTPTLTPSPWPTSTPTPTFTPPPTATPTPEPTNTSTPITGLQFDATPVAGFNRTQGFGANQFACDSCQGECDPKLNTPASCQYRSTRGLHNGLDLLVPDGTPVYWTSHTKGTVVAVGQTHPDAVSNVVVEADGYMTLFGHLQDNSWDPLKVNDEVTNGTLIGKTGAGHLHFGIKTATRHYNPLYFFDSSVANAFVAKMGAYIEGEDAWSMRSFPRVGKCEMWFWGQAPDRTGIER